VHKIQNASVQIRRMWIPPSQYVKRPVKRSVYARTTSSSITLTHTYTKHTSVVRGLHVMAAVKQTCNITNLSAELKINNLRRKVAAKLKLGKICPQAMMDGIHKQCHWTCDCVGGSDASSVLRTVRRQVITMADRAIDVECQNISQQQYTCTNSGKK